MKHFKKIVVMLASIALAFGFYYAPAISIASAQSVETVYLSSDSFVEETEQDSNEIEEGAQDTEEEKSNPTFDDFMAWAQEQAEDFGYGDEFADAIAAIRLAATEKQVTISTIASVSLAAFVLVMIIVNKVKDAKWKKALSNISEKLNNLVDGTNGLIDETAKAEGEVGKTERTAEEIKEDVIALKRGMKAILLAFMHFTDGVNMKTVKKEEVQIDCLTAIKSFDEVSADEDNEK